MAGAQEVARVAKVETVTMVMERLAIFLHDKFTVDEDMKSALDEFKAMILSEVDANAVAAMKEVKAEKTAKAEKKPRAPRKLTMFNLFTQEKMIELREAGVKGDKEKGNLLSQASAVWSEMSKEEKDAYTAANQARLDELNASKSSEPVVTEEKPKAKRGRKPKAATPVSVDTIVTPEESASDSEIKPVEVEEAAPVEEKPKAKRGRKPKTVAVPEEPVAEEETEKKTKKTANKPEVNIAVIKRVPYAHMFIEMLCDSKVTKAEQTKVITLVNTICQQFCEDLAEEEVPEYSFPEELLEQIGEAELLTKKAGKDLLAAFNKEIHREDESEE